MRHLSHVLLLAALTATALTALLASPAPGRPAADDVTIGLSLLPPASGLVVLGLNFQINVEVAASSAGVEQTFTVRIGLPAGLRWGSDAPDPGEGCTGTAPAVCMQKMQRNAVGTVGGGWSWDVVADRVGFYEITATVEPEQLDPNLSNNTFTLRFEVKQGTSGSTAATASAVKLSPAKPRAGSLVAASVRVTAGGTPVRPSRVTCSGAVGEAKLKGTPRAGSWTATCLYHPPKTAKGKTLRGAVSFTAKGTTFTRHFAAKLG